MSVNRYICVFLLIAVAFICGAMSCSADVPAISAAIPTVSSPLTQSAVSESSSAVEATGTVQARTNIRVYAKDTYGNPIPSAKITVNNSSKGKTDERGLLTISANIGQTIVISASKKDTSCESGRIFGSKSYTVVKDGYVYLTMACLA